MKKFKLGHLSVLSLSVFFALALFLLSKQSAIAVVNSVTPSTNDINRTNEWAHVDQLSQGIGTTDLQFISTRDFYSCFEYRTDGDTTQILTKNGGANYNTLITDGLYPYFCQKNDSATHTITANEYVEIRMVFGAETDERFDWTRFEVDPAPAPEPLDVCRNIEGAQSSVPDGMHLDASGLNCVNFSQSGPPPRTDEVAGGQVLGTSTTAQPARNQVLGVTTMAKTGNFAEALYLAIMGLGATLTTKAVKGFKKAFKKA